MEIQKLFMAVGVVIVGVIAVFAWIVPVSDGLAVANVTSSFNGTAWAIRNTVGGALVNTSIDIEGSTTLPEGGSPSDAQAGLLENVNSAISTVRKMFDIVPAMIGDGADLLHIDDEIQNLAKTMFIVIFGITLVYIMLLGIQRFV